MTQDTEDDGVVGGINVTPLVDITLVLLIIFMVTAHFVHEGGVPVHLPKAAETETVSPEALRITLDEQGALFLEKNKITATALKPRLAAITTGNPALRVIVAADKNTRHGELVALLDLLREAKITKIAIASEK